jgi:DNA-binding NtrC family response regulator
MGRAHHTPHLALIVEDDPGVRELAAALLEEVPLDIVEVESAEAALIFMQQRGGEVALVFADVRLSGMMDGLQMAGAICKLWPTVKVVVTSGDPTVELDGLPPCATFMPKPWRALDVLIEAERAIKAPPAAVH